jgi:prolyl oligopeptidase
VSSFLNIECLDQPTKVNSRYFYRRRKKDQEQACICTRDAVTGVEGVLVDPTDQGPFAAVAIHRISDDGLLLAYELREGGSDAKSIHVVDVESGRTLPDHLETGYARGFDFAPDGTGFYYCHELAEKTGPHTIRLHRFGEAANRDQVIFRIGRTRQSRLVLAIDGTHRLLSLLPRAQFTMDSFA